MKISTMGSLILFILVNCIICEGFQFSTLLKISKVNLEMSTQFIEHDHKIKQRTSFNINDIAPSSSSNTPSYYSSKKFASSGTVFSHQYKNLRRLTQREEVVVGKISTIGKRLDKIREALRSRLDREPSYSEWAEECGIDEPTLVKYIDMTSKARNLLVLHNMGLVDYFCKSIMKMSTKARGLSYFELITEGIIGLTKAAENYDGRTRFATYSQLFIKSAIYQAITKLQPGALLSHREAIYNNRAKKIKYVLREELNREPTDAEVAQKLSVPVTYLKLIRERASKKMISANHAIDVKSNTDNDSIGSQSYLDMDLSSDDSISNSDELIWHINFKSALNVLTPEEKRLLGLRYGFLDGIARSIPRSAELMCISEESARTTMLKAFEKLKSSPVSDLLQNGPPTVNANTLGNKISAKQY